MRIKRLLMQHVGRFETLEMPFAPSEEGEGRVTVIIGNNGAGKSSILEALSTSLSWLVARILREKGAGKAIDDLTICNGTSYATVETVVESKGIEFRWSLAKTLKGRKKCVDSYLGGVTKLADTFRSSLTEDDSSSLPIMVYYSVERSVLDIPMKLKSMHTFGQLDGYDKSLHQGVDFRRFFEWFRERDATENSSFSHQFERVISDVGGVQSIEDINQNKELLQKILRLRIESRDIQLDAVRQAVTSFMPGFENLRLERKPRLRMMVSKGNQELDVSQLSQGEKSLMALVGDLARRLAMMNPSLKNSLEGEGVVLIDELDMHLHPSWQRNIIRNLQGTFPNCQFVLTTHSPLVISDAPNILTYVLDDGELKKVGNLYGLDANQVLLQEMDTDIRNPEVQGRLDDLFDKIQDGEIEDAKVMLAALEEELPLDHWELNKARILILRKEALGA